MCFPGLQPDNRTDWSRTILMCESGLYTHVSDQNATPGPIKQGSVVLPLLFHSNYLRINSKPVDAIIKNHNPYVPIPLHSVSYGMDTFQSCLIVSIPIVIVLLRYVCIYTNYIDLSLIRL